LHHLFEPDRKPSDVQEEENMKSNAASRYEYTFDSLESGVTRSVHYASVSQGGIDIRVDWAGGSSGGTFDVLVDGGIWEACVNLESGAPCDLLMSQPSFDHVRFSRGPKCSMYPFEAKLVPIEWKPGREPAADCPEDTVVELGVDYEYASNITPDSVSWHESVLQSGGYGLALELEQDRDYEVWVHLSDPDYPSQGLALLTIVRPGDGDPTPSK
jgi:hypothetical protein